MAKIESKTVKPTEEKKTIVKEESPKEETPNVKPISTVGEEVKEQPKEVPVTKDESSNTIEVNGETILNGGKDALEGNPVEGIDNKAEGAKEMLDTQKKAEEAIKDGSSGLGAIGTAEVMNGLVKDVNSDRPVYETHSAYLSAMTASGKLAGE